MYNICIMLYSIIQKNYIYMLHDFSCDRKVFFYIQLWLLLLFSYKFKFKKTYFIYIYVLD